MQETDHPYISVSFSEESIKVIFKRENKIVKNIKWNEIKRIFYKTYDYGAPDFIYLSLDNFPLKKGNKVIIPVTETGGEALWEEIKKRGLFDQNLAVHAEMSENEITSWPEM